MRPALIILALFHSLALAGDYEFARENLRAAFVQEATPRVLIERMKALDATEASADVLVKGLEHPSTQVQDVALLRLLEVARNTTKPTPWVTEVERIASNPSYRKSALQLLLNTPVTREVTLRQLSLPSAPREERLLAARHHFSHGTGLAAELARDSDPEVRAYGVLRRILLSGESVNPADQREVVRVFENPAVSEETRQAVSNTLRRKPLTDVGAMVTLIRSRDAELKGLDPALFRPLERDELLAISDDDRKAIEAELADLISDPRHSAQVHKDAADLFACIGVSPKTVARLEKDLKGDETFRRAIAHRERYLFAPVLRTPVMSRSAAKATIDRLSKQTDDSGLRRGLLELVHHPSANLRGEIYQELRRRFRDEPMHAGEKSALYSDKSSVVLDMLGLEFDPENSDRFLDGVVRGQASFTIAPEVLDQWEKEMPIRLDADWENRYRRFINRAQSRRDTMELREDSPRILNLLFEMERASRHKPTWAREWLDQLVTDYAHSEKPALRKAALDLLGKRSTMPAERLNDLMVRLEQGAYGEDQGRVEAAIRRAVNEPLKHPEFFGEASTEKFAKSENPTVRAFGHKLLTETPSGRAKASRSSDPDLKQLAADRRHEGRLKAVETTCRTSARLLLLPSRRLIVASILLATAPPGIAFTKSYFEKVFSDRQMRNFLGSAPSTRALTEEDYQLLGRTLRERLLEFPGPPDTLPRFVTAYRKGMGEENFRELLRKHGFSEKDLCDPKAMQVFRDRSAWFQNRGPALDALLSDIGRWQVQRFEENAASWGVKNWVNVHGEAVTIDSAFLWVSDGSRHLPTDRAILPWGPNLSSEQRHTELLRAIRSRRDNGGSLQKLLSRDDSVQAKFVEGRLKARNIPYEIDRGRIDVDDYRHAAALDEIAIENAERVWEILLENGRRAGMNGTFADEDGDPIAFRDAFRFLQRSWDADNRLIPASIAYAQAKKILPEEIERLTSERTDRLDPSWAYELHRRNPVGFERILRKNGLEIQGKSDAAWFKALEKFGTHQPENLETALREAFRGEAYREAIALKGLYTVEDSVTDTWNRISSATLPDTVKAMGQYQLIPPDFRRSRPFKILGDGIKITKEDLLKPALESKAFAEIERTLRLKGYTLRLSDERVEGVTSVGSHVFEGADGTVLGLTYRNKNTGNIEVVMREKAPLMVLLAELRHVNNLSAGVPIFSSERAMIESERDVHAAVLEIAKEHEIELSNAEQTAVIGSIIHLHQQMLQLEKREKAEAEKNDSDGRVDRQFGNGIVD